MNTLRRTALRSIGYRLLHAVGLTTHAALDRAHNLTTRMSNLLNDRDADLHANSRTIETLRHQRDRLAEQRVIYRSKAAELQLQLDRTSDALDKSRRDRIKLRATLDSIARKVAASMY